MMLTIESQVMASEIDIPLHDLNLSLLELNPFDFERLINDIKLPYSKPMQQWNSQEVLEFIFNEIHPRLSKNDLKRFQCISGYIFMSLTEENCKLLCKSEKIAKAIFEVKERHRLYECMELTHLEEITSQQDFFHSNDGFANTGTNSRPRKTQNKALLIKNGKRSKKLWEFILHLLCDDETCPKLIKWENFEEGTFKFVQTSQVAMLWGRRKQNEKMTYEKFSRAMRYYYKSKVLLPVPGKRLVYKFGPQANGWRDVTPIK